MHMERRYKFILSLEDSSLVLTMITMKAKQLRKFKTKFSTFEIEKLNFNDNEKVYNQKEIKLICMHSANN